MLGDRSGRVAALAATLALTSGCASVSPSRTSAGSGGDDTPAARVEPPLAQARHPVAMLALEMVGVPYRYGGADPRGGFDCSGLVFYAYTQNGFSVPRTSQDQFKAARKIALSEASEGDLVFFQDQEKLSHVGIYTGGGLFVHAPSTGTAVSVASLDEPYYQRHLVAVGRLLPD